MDPLKLKIPTIAITGSSGKTTTRELLACILEKKWKILKTSGNQNLPLNTKHIAKSYTFSHKAIVIELGMGKPGAGERHCEFIIPNISVITNIGTAHYGNLGNSIQSTAKNKSALIHLMDPTGTLLINADDNNSKYLETEQFQGKIITIGTSNKADYQAFNIKYLTNGISFDVQSSTMKAIKFTVPAYGIHNVHNALFAIAIADQLQFTPEEIQNGFNGYVPPKKRLNVYPMKSRSVLIDDTVNANPHSMKTAIDVLAQLGNRKKKIAILGGMLELGEYTVTGHREVGKYVREKKIDYLFTYGEEAAYIHQGAIAAGFTNRRCQHFQSREALHQYLSNIMGPDCVVLVKGSSATKMGETVKHLLYSYLYSIQLATNTDPNTMSMNQETKSLLNIETEKIYLQFGHFKKELSVEMDPSLEIGTVKLPKNLSQLITIPDLPYDFYVSENHFHLGPVIGMLILPRYQKDPNLQLARFSSYSSIRGLICLFNQNNINTDNEVVSGYYYNPATKSFEVGTFPYPSVLFKRSTTVSGKYKRLAAKLGDAAIFNHPYGNVNKLDFWKIHSKRTNVKPHLPETIEFKNTTTITKMLAKHPGIYLKPTTLAGGSGILYIRNNATGFQIIDETGNGTFAADKNQLASVLASSMINGKPYIVQQEIPYAKEGHKVDFRLYLQKNQTMRWQYSGMETKIAKTGSIISNSKNRERIMPGETALKEIYGLNEQQIEEKIDEIVALCKRVLRTMEKRGAHIADTAVDFIIDHNLKIWLLEVQPNYAAEIKALRDDSEQRILSSILPTPFAYAKALAGFVD